MNGKTGGERSLAIAGRIFRQFLRDRRTLALLFIVPVAIMSLLGYLIQEEKEGIPVGLVQADRDLERPGMGVVRLGEALARHLRAQPVLVVRDVTKETGRADIGADRLKALIIIPADFSAKLLAAAPAAVHLVLEGSQPSVAGQVQAAVARALAAFGAEVAAARPGPPGSSPAGAGGPPVELSIEFRSAGPNWEALDYFAPPFIAAFAFFFTFLLTSVSFLRERASGTMERLLASPAARGEIVLGYVLGFSFFALIQSMVLLGYALWVLDVRVAGDVGLVFLVVLAVTLGTVSLGIVLSFYARNELQVMQFIPLVVTPQILLAGTIWPVETLAGPLRVLAWFMPLSHTNTALRAVMIRGQGWEAIAGDMAFLAVFAVAMAVLAMGVLRREVA